MTATESARLVRAGGARARVEPEALAWTRAVLARGETLYGAAGAVVPKLELSGRGPLWVIPAQEGVGEPAARWAVRRYRRGGAVAPVLGDRYLRVGAPRPFREMEAARLARERGVPTPRVVAAAVYPAGLFYRADLVTAYVERSRDLAGVLFGSAASPAREDAPGREDALARAGALVTTLAEAGVEHPDLNAKNILLQEEGARVTAWLVDLDRARVRPPGERADGAAMLRRLERSLRGFEGATGTALTPGEREALAAGARGGEASA